MLTWSGNTWFIVDGISIDECLLSRWFREQRKVQEIESSTKSIILLRSVISLPSDIVMLKIVSIRSGKGAWSVYYVHNNFHLVWRFDFHKQGQQTWVVNLTDVSYLVRTRGLLYFDSLVLALVFNYRIWIIFYIIVNFKKNLSPIWFQIELYLSKYLLLLHWTSRYENWNFDRLCGKRE
jgi:hypothetical protein